MSCFKIVFEEYGGNYEMTMSRFMGSEDFYLRILKMLFKDDNFDKLGKALQEGDFQEAFDAAHALKGVAGNLGLTPLYNEVCEIVESLRKKKYDSDYLELYRKIEVEYKKIATLWEDLSEGGKQS